MRFSRSLPDPQITSDRIGSMLLDLVHTKVSELSVALNLQRVSIFRLPAELMIDVFEELAVSERFIASQVCKIWRDILLAAPHIWAKIVYGRRISSGTSFMSSHSALQRLLDLSNPCHIRVDIEISHPDFGWNRVFSMLRHSMPRISALQLSVYSDDLTPDDLESLGNLLRTPAPVLRTFLLEDCRTNVSPSLDRPFHLFDQRAPLLRDIILQMDIGLLSDSATTLQTAQRVLFNHTSRTGAQHLALMLQLAPQATDIMICLQDWDESEPIPLDPLPLPKSLQMLNLYANGSIDVAVKAMRCIQWQNVQRFELFRKGPELNALAGLFALGGRSLDDILGAEEPASSSRFIVRTAAIDWYIEPDTVSPERGPIIHMYDVDAEMHRLVPLESMEKVDLPVQRERIFFEIAEPLPGWLFTHLTRLYLSELVLDPDTLRDELPPLPVLSHLTVWIMPSKYHSAGVGTSLFIEVRDTGQLQPI